MSCKSLLQLLYTCAILIVFPGMIKAQNLPPYSAVLRDQAGTNLSPENMISLPGGDYLVAGNRYNEGFLMRMDSLANPLWVRSYGLGLPFVSPNIRFRFLNKTLDGNAIVAGSCLDTTGQSLSGFLMKVNLNGDTMWCRKVELPGFGGELLFVSPTSDSGFICCGYLDEKGTGGQVIQRYIHAMKTDADGHTLWSTAIDAGTNNDYGRVIREISTGGFLLAGYREDFPPFDAGAVFVRLSNNGSIIHAVQLQSPSTVSPFCAGNDFLELNGTFYFYVNTDNGPAIARMDSSGNIISQFILAGQGSGGLLLYTGARIKLLADGNLLFVNDDLSVGFAVKADTAGNVIWTRSQLMRTYDVIEDSDGSLAFLGGGPLIGVTPWESMRTGSDTETGILLTDDMGLEPQCTQSGIISTQASFLNSSPFSYTSLTGGVTVPLVVQNQPQIVLRFLDCVSITGGLSENKGELSLQIYPNPGIGEIHLSASATIDELTVWDASGRELIQSWPNSATTEIKMNDYPAGIYWVKVEIDGSTLMKKLLLLPEY